jgi:hypothetical protein
MTSLPVSLSSLSVTQSPSAPSFTIQGAAGVALENLGLPRISVDLGYFDVKGLVGGVELADVQLPNGLKLVPDSSTSSSSSSSTSTNATASSGSSPTSPAAMRPLNLDAIATISPSTNQTTTALQHFADAVLYPSDHPSGSSVGITGIRFGSSESRSFITFSQIRAELSTSMIQPLITKLSTNLQPTLLKPRSLKISQVGLQLQRSTQASISVGAEWINHVLPRLTVSLQGPMEFQADLDSQALLRGSVPGGLNLDSEYQKPASVNLDVDMRLSDGSLGVKESLGRLVTGALNGESISSTGVQVFVSGLRVGSITQFSGLKVRLPPTILDMVNPLSSTGFKADSVLDLSPILPTPETLQNLKIQPSSVSLVSRPSSRIDASAAFSYTNPLSISASVPYFSTSIALNQAADALRIAATNVNLARERGTMNPTMSIQFSDSDAVPPAMASVVSQVIETGKLGTSTKIQISQIRFGSSDPSDVSTLFSEIQLNVETFVQDMELGGYIHAFVNAVSPIPLPATIQDITTWVSESNPGGSLQVSTLPQSQMSVNAGLQFQLPFSVSLDLGYFGVGVGVSGEPLLDSTLPRGLKMSSGGSAGSFADKVGVRVDLSTLLKFTDTEKTRDNVAGLVDAVLNGNGNNVGGNVRLDVGKLAVGASQQDTIKALSQIQLSLPLTSIIKIQGQTTDLATILSSFQPLVSGEISVVTQPGQQLGVKASVSLDLPVAVSADFGYFSTSTTLEKHPLANVVLPVGVRIQPDANRKAQVNVDTSLQMTDNENTQEVVKEVVQRMLDGKPLNVRAGLGGIRFGENAEDRIRVLEKCELPLDLDRALEILLMGSTAQNGANSTTTSTASTKSLLNIKEILQNLKPSIGATDVVTKPKSTLGVSTSLEFDFALPFKISFKAGYLAAQAGLSGQPLAQFALPGFELNAVNATRKSMAVKTDVEFVDQESTRDVLAGVVDRFLGGQKVKYLNCCFFFVAHPLKFLGLLMCCFSYSS